MTGPGGPIHTCAWAGRAAESSATVPKPRAVRFQSFIHELLSGVSYSAAPATCRGRYRPTSGEGTSRMRQAQPDWRLRRMLHRVQGGAELGFVLVGEVGLDDGPAELPDLVQDLVSGHLPDEHAQGGGAGLERRAQLFHEVVVDPHV